eukprot:384605-Alexandrium_andersonii.AAC.1
MSASLVGSEMCIRDREQPSICSESASVLRLKLRSAVASDCDWELRLAVSYTHLTLPTICSV